jgi:hypothetical protein
VQRSILRALLGLAAILAIAAAWIGPLLVGPGLRPQLAVVAVRPIHACTPIVRQDVGFALVRSGEQGFVRDIDQTVGAMLPREISADETIPIADVSNIAKERCAAQFGGSELLARWVQLVPSNPACGALKSDDKSTAPSRGACAPKFLVRAVLAPRKDCENVAFRSAQHLALAMRIRANPDPKGFPVTLCEGVAEASDKEVRFIDGSRISWQGLEPLTRVSAIGDTGCDNTAGTHQNCLEPRSWPFSGVALVDAGVIDGSPPPGLVIHVGDYRYRTSSKGQNDNWEHWVEDFFKPAQPLLLTAPWIMVRGNHENCYKEDGNGWFFLLAPDDDVVARCPADPDRDGDNRPPYAIDLQGAGDLRLVVMDAANAKYRCASWARDFRARSEPRLKAMVEGIDAPIWLLTHYPVWDISESYLVEDEATNSVIRCASPHETAPTVLLYRELMDAVIRSPKVVGHVRAVISGDTHHFQFLRVHEPAGIGPALANDSRFPLQIVAGNGGTKIDPAVGPRGPNGELARSCAGADPVAYFQRVVGGSGNAAGSVVGKAVCSYGYVSGEWVNQDWQFHLKPLGRAQQSEDQPCAIGTNSPACYSAPASRHCILLHGQSTAGGPQDCLPLQ